MKDHEKSAPVVERLDVLPCDVRVAPATTIRKGCKVETLMQCIELRKGQPPEFTVFKSSSPPELAELQAIIARLTAEIEDWKQGSKVEADAGDEARAEVTALRLENERLKHDHQYMVGRNALLRQRPDLPVDRIPAHSQLAELQAENERLKSESFEALYNDAIDEIERLKGGQGEAVGIVRVTKQDDRTCYEGIMLAPAILEGAVENGTKLYISQPAPVSVSVSAMSDEMIQLLQRASVYARGEFLAEINACLDKLKELNQ